MWNVCSSRNRFLDVSPVKLNWFKWLHQLINLSLSFWRGLLIQSKTCSTVAGKNKKGSWDVCRFCLFHRGPESHLFPPPSQQVRHLVSYGLFPLASTQSRFVGFPILANTWYRTPLFRTHFAGFPNVASPAERTTSENCRPRPYDNPSHQRVWGKSPDWTELLSIAFMSSVVTSGCVRITSPSFLKSMPTQLFEVYLKLVFL